MRIPFRFALLAILLGLLGATVILLGINSYSNASFTARDLSDQLLDQTSLRIDQQIAELLSEATEHGALSQRLLTAGRLRADDPSGLVAYWADVLEVNQELTSLFIGLQETGECVGVSRLTPSGSSHFSVWQSSRNPATDKLEEKEFHIGDYPHKPYAFDPGKQAPDIRQRPWYRAAREARGPVWTNTVAFIGFEGVRGIHGLTYATPVYKRTNGSLEAVVAADFELRGLCRFLQTLRIGRTGFAFVLEFRADGSRWVVAHRNAAILTREVRRPDKGTATELVPLPEIADPELQAFVAHLPKTIPAEAAKYLTPVSFALDGVSFMGGYRRLGGKDNPDWLICTVIPEADVMDRVHRNNRNTLVLGVMIFLLAVAISFYGSGQVAQPLERLEKEAAAIGRLQLDPRPAKRSLVREVDRLALAFEKMKTGLRSFQKYVPSDLVRSLLTSNQEAGLGGERRMVTVFFCDIADFTATAERMSPEELVEHLRAYLSVLSGEILQTGGTVDKYIGDAIMAFWGAPALDPQHALAACTAALGCQARLRELRLRWEAEGKPPFFARIGINTGDVVIGNIGSEARLNYTVIGDAVNLASRLEGSNKIYSTEVIISESTYRQAGAAIVARPLDWVVVKGKTEPVLIYELLGLHGDADSDAIELAALYGQALAVYRRQDWREAIALFERVLKLRPNDPPARLMIARCGEYLTQPPAEGWDGVYRLDSK